MTEGTNLPSAGQERSRLLAERLREAREYLGLPQQFVADQTGIPRVAISAIENGKRRVEAIELETLARLYKHPVAYFLEGSVETPPEITALAREARDLTQADREEVLRFARFLKAYGGSGARSSRTSGGEG